MKHILVIPGDGIGPEVILPTVEILSELASGIDFEYAGAGKALFEAEGFSISEGTIEAARKADAVLFGATETVYSSAYRSPVLDLRQKLDLFANVRIIRELRPNRKKVDFVIFRENTEGMYTRDEEQLPGEVITHRRISESACRRISEFSLSYCEEHGIGEIVCVHKANVLRLSDGLFLRIFREIASGYAEIESSDMLVDAAAMNIAMAPERFRAITTLNLYGDILSDLGAGLVGGLGFVPSANIGQMNAMFEPAHGSAPDIAGKGMANPFAAILSSAMMLDHIGFRKESEKLAEAVRSAVPGVEVDEKGRCDTFSAVDTVKRILFRS